MSPFSFMPRLPRMGIRTLLVLLSLSAFVQAEETSLKVLVRADDAKFIGSGVGGLNVAVAHAHTGEVLAQGQITGGTGDTQALMKSGQTRGQSPVSQDAASFQATLDLQRPTPLTVSATGPLNVPEESMQTVSTTLWMVPGKHVEDPGLILHMPGLITDLSQFSRDGRELSLTAEVTMMCGCPITKDGLWDSDNLKAVAQLYRNGKVVGEQALQFTGERNLFGGSITAPESGDYLLAVYAYQNTTGNTGVYERQVSIP